MIKCNAPKEQTQYAVEEDNDKDKKDWSRSKLQNTREK